LKNLLNPGTKHKHIWARYLGIPARRSIRLSTSLRIGHRRSCCRRVAEFTHGLSWLLWCRTSTDVWRRPETQEYGKSVTEPSTLPTTNLLFLVWHAPLGVHSTICRHQPPQRAVLGQVDCFVQCEVVGSQTSLDGVQPHDMRTPAYTNQFPSSLHGHVHWAY